jgi:hypothetical protein
MSTSVRRKAPLIMKFGVCVDQKSTAMLSMQMHNHFCRQACAPMCAIECCRHVQWMLPCVRSFRPMLKWPSSQVPGAKQAEVLQHFHGKQAPSIHVPWRHVRLLLSPEPSFLGALALQHPQLLVPLREWLHLCC